MEKPQKNIVVFVDLAPKQAIEEVRKHFEGCRVLVLRDIKHKAKDGDGTFHADFVVHVDFTKPHKIAESLLPYQDELMVVTARGEGGAARLRELIPHVPYLRTPTPDSLKWATDKYQMRCRMKLYDPKNTPTFTKVKENTKKERKRIVEKVGFPMVVKPANLEASMLVTICYHEEELEKGLRNIFRKLRNEYEKHNRLQLPTIMAEEYMDGDMYSIDSYVDSRGHVWHCPLVSVKTGRNIGHDDFYNYLQITPTALKKESIAAAQASAETAIHALGLRSVTAHVEMMKVDNEWKVIEVGPRVGGNRPLIYGLSCDINHSLNDILVRVPKKPIVPKKCKGVAGYLKFYAEKEGWITEIKGIKKVEEVESFHSIVVNKKVGDRATFSKNGGKPIFTVFLTNTERSKFLADVRRVEQMVEIKVGNGRQAKSAQPKAKKVAAKKKE